MMTPLAFPSSFNPNFPNTIVSSSSSFSINNNSNRYQPCTIPFAGGDAVSSTSSTTVRMLGQRRQRVICCGVAVESDSATIDTSSASATAAAANDGELSGAKVGARVRVKVPLKVYHVPKVPELDLNGMVGELKQYVGLWKGKRISANLPYKVAFVIDIQGRGPVKFFAHLKEDEFEYVE